MVVIIAKVIVVVVVTVLDWYDGVDVLNFHGDNYNGTGTDVSGMSLDTVANNATNMAVTANPVEEESQVVPVLLDHLSRDELCRMIYRLDYERNNIREQLTDVTLRNQQLTQLKSKKTNGHGGSKKRKKQRRTETAAQSSQVSQPQQPEIGQGVDEQIPAATTILPQLPPLMAPLEISNIQKEVGQRLLSTIQKSAIHGLRQIPKTTITEGGLSLATITAMMRNYNTQRVSNTKRMIKWTMLPICCQQLQLRLQGSWRTYSPCSTIGYFR